MEITYKSKLYKDKYQYRRYVRKLDDNTYFYIEVYQGYDYLQGKVSKDELPKEIADKADAKYGYFPSYVDWPY